VGIVISPTGVTGNGAKGFVTENIHVVDCSINETRSPFAFGHDRIRNVLLSNVATTSSLFFIDGRSYGTGYGAPPCVQGANVGTTQMLFNVHVTRTFSVTALYSESSFSVGHLLEGGGVAVFDNCTFAFKSAVARPNVDYHVRSTAPVCFNACEFGL